jgi:hypothetical protein
MLEFLNKPYPFSFQSSRRIKQLLPIGLCVFVFLILFKPFGLSNAPDYIQISAFLSFSGTFIGLLTTVLIPYLFPRYFNESKWTLKRSLIWNTWTFFIFATLMFIAFNIYSIYQYDNHRNFTFNTYLWWVYINLIFGLPLGIIINLFNQYYLLKKHHNIAASINNTIETSMIKNSQKSLKDNMDVPLDLDKQKHLSKEIKNRHASVNTLEYEVDKFKKVQIEIDNLIYVEALGNYINIVYVRNGIKKITIRETINNIEQKISPSEMIYKSHRSYLVNLHYIVNVTGDAQGLKIHFKDIDIAVPVSRNKIKEFRLLTSSRM